MSKEIKDITEEVKEVEEVEEDNQEAEEVEITGGIILLRTDDGRIVYEKIDDVSWEDITMFAEYLNRLKDVVWEEHTGVDKNED